MMPSLCVISITHIYGIELHLPLIFPQVLSLLFGLEICPYGLHNCLMLDIRLDTTPLLPGAEQYSYARK
jgi:hypothetical protein